MYTSVRQSQIEDKGDFSSQLQTPLDAVSITTHGTRHRSPCRSGTGSGSCITPRDHTEKRKNELCTTTSLYYETPAPVAQRRQPEDTLDEQTRVVRRESPPRYISCITYMADTECPGAGCDKSRYAATSRAKAKAKAKAKAMGPLVYA